MARLLLSLLLSLLSLLPLLAANSNNIISNLWSGVAFEAAEAAVHAIQQQSGHEVTLRDVPLETLQVRTHHWHQVGCITTCTPSSHRAPTCCRSSWASATSWASRLTESHTSH
jgi:hypothetical protein